MNDIVKTHKSDNPTISLSNNAKNYIQQIMNKSPEKNGVYLAVKNTGCSGMSYVFEIVEDVPKDSKDCLQENGITVYIDRKSLPYLTGTVIDYITEGLNKKIIFNNPNAQNTCGCGESFSMK